MIEPFELTKRNFIGDISLDTPDIVILDIVSAYNLKVDKSRLSDVIYRSQVIIELNKRKPYILTDLKITKSNVKKIASFLNGDNKITWFAKSLVDSLINTIDIMKNPDKLHSESKVGYPTPQNTSLISPAICYGILRNKGYSLSSKINISDLQNLLDFSFQPYHIGVFLEKLYNFERRDIDNVIVSKYIMDSTASYPLNYEMAIAIAAVKYRIDISSAENPFLELYALQTKTFPFSQRMKTIHRVNPRAFDISAYFNPIFPKELYTQDELTHLADKNGIKRAGRINVDDIYGYLSVKFSLPSFYKSVAPQVTEFETPLALHNLNELTPRTPIVSFGSEGKFHVYTVDELTEIFENYQMFKLGEDQPVTITAVGDLTRMIASAISQRSVTRAEKKSWEKLGTIISVIEELFKQTDFHKESFINYYKESDDKSIIVKILKLILVLAMYMRGWNGKSVLPIKDKDIPRFTDQDYERKKLKANKRSFQTIEKLKNLTRNKIGQDILELPLLEFFNGKFKISTEFQQGATIGERLKIIEQDLIINACIGMSSNWLLASAYFYLDAISMKPDFNIQDADRVTESTRRMNEIAIY